MLNIKGLFKLNKNKKGFTFVEVIVAVALLAIVGTLAFSMFSNSARYMSKAKQEEEKQTIAQDMAAKDTFMNSSGDYKIYKTSTLVVDYSLTGTNSGIPNYYAKLTYSTKYGDVDIRLPIRLAPDSSGKQPCVEIEDGGTAYMPYSFSRYMVISDSVVLDKDGKMIGKTGRYIFIHDNNEREGTVSAAQLKKYE